MGLPARAGSRHGHGGFADRVRCRAVRVALTGTLAAMALTGCSADEPPDCARDPLEERVLAELDSYVSWLRDNDVEGFVGEVGWPGGGDAARWNRLGDAWYDAADAAELPVTVWAAAQWWPADYPLAVYRDPEGGHGPALRPGPQANVVERHSGTSRYGRGVAEASASFGTEAEGYSAQQPGRYGRDYSFPSAASLDYLAERGHRLVRLAFTWERIQPRPHGPLSHVELSRLLETVRNARAAGLDVVLDLHSYGRFRVTTDEGRVDELVLGTDALPAAALADVWRRLATVFRREDGIWGYGLMNEPHDLPGPRNGAHTWERASQAAVDAVRAVDARTQVVVAGAGWSRAADWTRTHPQPWIDDPAGAVRYEAHQYFDRDGSGTYARGYQDEVAAARRSGYRVGC